MIDISVLDTNFNVVGVIDTYESFIWTDRFQTFGDFELYSKVDSNILDLCRQDYYLYIPNSYHMMIIETIEIKTDPEAGNHITVKGRSLESILDRRIMWDETIISNGRDHTLATAIEVLVKSCFGCDGTLSRDGKTVSCTIELNNGRTQTVIVRSERYISYFKYRKTTDQSILDLTIDKTQYTGDNLYTIMQDILEANSNVGYRILPGWAMNRIYNINTYQDYDLVFELYSGVDRSYNQTADPELPYVVFSPDFDNIINTDYIDDVQSMKNVTLVLGEESETDRKRLIVGGKDDQGNYIDSFIRRELYTDARDLQSEDYGGPESDDYEDALKTRGLENLYESCRIVTYDGEVDSNRMFVYGEHFIMGDIIQIKNEYGVEGSARVVEYIISDNTSGTSFYPTFSDISILSDDTEDDSQPLSYE